MFVFKSHYTKIAVGDIYIYIKNPLLITRDLDRILHRRHDSIYTLCFFSKIQGINLTSKYSSNVNLSQEPRDCVRRDFLNKFMSKDSHFRTSRVLFGTLYSDHVIAKTKQNKRMPFDFTWNNAEHCG